MYIVLFFQSTNQLEYQTKFFVSYKNLCETADITHMTMKTRLNSGVVGCTHQEGGGHTPLVEVLDRSVVVHKVLLHAARVFF